MKNFTIYRESKYDYKANAALKLDAFGDFAGAAAIKGLKGLAIAALNVSEKAISGRTVSDSDLAYLGLK